MNAPETPPSSLPLPRYGIGEDEMTRPFIVLFDWTSDDDEATIHDGPVVAYPVTLDEDDLDTNLFRPRWQGVGRRPGAVALAVVLAVSVAIGFGALLASEDAQAGGATGMSLSVR